MTPDVRLRRVLAVAALLAGFGVALPRFLTHGTYPRLGAAMGEGGVVQGVLGPPARGTLVPGDRLLRLNGMVLADSAVRARLASEGWPRGPLELEFEHEGFVRRVTLPPTRLSPWERFRLRAYPIALAVAAPLVAFLLVWRRPDLGTAWVFLWFATLDGLGVLRTVFPHSQVAPGPLFRMYLALYNGLVLLYPASFVHFMSVFPRPRWRAGSDPQRRRARAVWSPGSCASESVERTPARCCWWRCSPARSRGRIGWRARAGRAARVICVSCAACTSARSIR